MNLLYSDKNTRVKNLRVRFLRKLGIGKQIEVEVMESWSHTYRENGQSIIKEFHRGQIIHVDEGRVMSLKNGESL